jgi:glucose 1-dehydrogenase/3-oxoacyl-[acyl-carrier protein] reductase
VFATKQGDVRVSQNDSLNGKLALVTGAGQGIGAGIADELARQGAAVVLHYAHSAEGAQRTVAAIRRRGGKAEAVQGDLGNPDDCLRVVDAAAGFLGGLDILVNNAGVSDTAPFLDCTPAFFDNIYGINIRGQFFCCQQAVRWMMKRGGGSIVNISSIHAFGAIPNHSVYAGTKGAINAFSRQLSIELIPLRVRVNVVAPGSIEVERKFRDPKYNSARQARRMVPWGRVGLPADIANLTAFLVSDAADFITGQVIYADGGLTAKLARQDVD